MSFDVEKLAKMSEMEIEGFVSQTGLKEDVQYIERLTLQKLTRAIEATEQKCINAECPACASGLKPERESQYTGWFHYYEHRSKHSCDADNIHELRYQREKPTDD